MGISSKKGGTVHHSGRSLCLLLSIVSLLLCVTRVHAASWYISPEQDDRAGTGTVAQQEQQARDVVDTQDDAWRAAISVTDTIVQGSFGAGPTINQGATPYPITSGGQTIGEITRVQLTSPSIGTPNGTTTQPKLEDAPTLQDMAPKPTSLQSERAWNESGGGSTNQRNAVRIEVMTGISGFGAWFGDVETRTDGDGTPAEVYLFDDTQTLMSTQTIAPTTGDQTGCGGGTSATSPSACGNETTRWIGFTLTPTESVQLQYIVIVVGDDDDANDAGTTDGNTEHISMIGPTFAIPCTDTDDDGVCDTDDICPDDPKKMQETSVVDAE